MSIHLIYFQQEAANSILISARTPSLYAIQSIQCEFMQDMASPY